MQTIRNSYSGVLEDWKVALILERARGKGFRQDELDDVQQEVALAVIGFHFDPAKANGASEAAVLRVLIDKQLTFIQRGCARAKNRVKKYQELHGATANGGAPPAVEPDHAEALALSMDVQGVMAKLSPKEKAVCAELAKGAPLKEIAKALGYSRYEVQMLIGRIREQFEEAGMTLR